MKRMLGALAICVAAMDSSAAQTPTTEDPKLCESLMAALGGAGPGGWEEGTPLSIPFEGGAATCSSQNDQKKQYCMIATVRLCASAQPTPQEIGKFQQALQYFRTRGAATLGACLKGATLQPYSKKTEFEGYVSASAGNEYVQQGKPTVRLLQGESRTIQGERRCQDQTIWLELEVQ